MYRIALALFTVLLAVPAVAEQSSTNAAPAPKPCTEPQQAQLDFWVGNWDLTWPGQNQGKVDHGTNRIERVMEGCVVQENFSGGDAMHLRGMRVSTFDARAGKWKQTWVDNEGGYLDLVGEFRDGQMVLSRQATRPDGSKVMQRMVWKYITHDELDWSWEASKDGGKSWQVLWPIHYKRKM